MHILLRDIFDFPITKEVDLVQIIKQRERFSVLRQVCDVNYPIQEVEATVAGDANLTEEVAVSMVRRIVFDDTSLVIVVVVSGTINTTNLLDNGFKKIVVVKPRRILQKHLVILNEKFSNGKVEKMLNEIAEEFDKKGVDLIIPAIPKENIEKV